MWSRGPSPATDRQPLSVHAVEEHWWTWANRPGLQCSILSAQNESGDNTGGDSGTKKSTNLFQASNLTEAGLSNFGYMHMHVMTEIW